jgi:hypothetical protein
MIQPIDKRVSMKINRRFRANRSLVAISAAVLGLGVVTAVAEQVVVQVQTLVIRSGKGSMYPPVAEVPNQTKLDVLERQPDGWLKVKANDKEGFIREAALKPRSPSMLGGASSAANTLTGNTSDVGAAAAGRGISEDAQAFAVSKGYNTAALDQMIANRNRVAGQRWIMFTQEGKVGPAKQ